MSDQKTGRPSPDGLRVAGPQLPLVVSIHPVLAAQLQKAGATLPLPVQGMALIDTGASATAVDGDALKALSISPIGRVEVRTPSGKEQQDLYPASLTFPGTQIPTLNFNAVLGSKLKEQGILALVGRDVLQHFLLIYNGHLGQYILSF